MLVLVLADGSGKGDSQCVSPERGGGKEWRLWAGRGVNSLATKDFLFFRSPGWGVAVWACACWLSLMRGRERVVSKVLDGTTSDIEEGGVKWTCRGVAVLGATDPPSADFL